MVAVKTSRLYIDQNCHVSDDAISAEAPYQAAPFFCLHDADVLWPARFIVQSVKSHNVDIRTHVVLYLISLAVLYVVESHHGASTHVIKPSQRFDIIRYASLGGPAKYDGICSELAWRCSIS